MQGQKSCTRRFSILCQISSRILRRKCSGSSRIFEEVSCSVSWETEGDHWKFIKTPRPVIFQCQVPRQTPQRKSERFLESRQVTGCCVCLVPKHAAKGPLRRKPQQTLAVHFWQSFFPDRGLMSPLFYRLPPTLQKAVLIGGKESSETGRIRFRGVRFQTPNSVSSSLVLTEFAPRNSVSSFQPIICVQKRTHRVFGRTHRVCRRTQ